MFVTEDSSINLSLCIILYYWWFNRGKTWCFDSFESIFYIDNL